MAGTKRAPDLAIQIRRRTEDARIAGHDWGGRIEWAIACGGQPATERDLLPNLHLKVEGNNAVMTYKYTHGRNRTERRLEKI